MRLIDSCITQLMAQGPSRTCNESTGEGEEEFREHTRCGVQCYHATGTHSHLRSQFKNNERSEVNPCSHCQRSSRSKRVPGTHSHLLNSSIILEQLLHGNVQRFRDGLVYKTHRLWFRVSGFGNTLVAVAGAAERKVETRNPKTGNLKLETRTPKTETLKGNTLVAVASAAERKVVEQARLVQQLTGERHPLVLLPLLTPFA